MVTTVAGVYDILFGMRRCRISLPNIPLGDGGMACDFGTIGA